LNSLGGVHYKKGAIFAHNKKREQERQGLWRERFARGSGRERCVCQTKEKSETPIRDQREEKRGGEKS